MTLIIIFIMFCCFGLGVSWNIVWTNIKELDAWIEQRKKEDKELEQAFKKGLDQITKDIFNNENQSQRNKLSSS